MAREEVHVYALRWLRRFFFCGVQLSRAVQAWEPREETVPLHAWMHPWLEMLGPQLEDLYPTIRFKLAAALQAWHPSDASALALLSPWHKVRGPIDIIITIALQRPPGIHVRLIGPIGTLSLPDVV